MMAALLLLISLSSSPTIASVQERNFDVVEFNHYYDKDGQLIFDQLIFYRWDGERFELIDCRTIRESGYYHNAIKSFTSSNNSILFISNDKLYKVRFGEFRETWTQEDPDVKDREKYQFEARKGL